MFRGQLSWTLALAGWGLVACDIQPSSDHDTRTAPLGSAPFLFVNNRASNPIHGLEAQASAQGFSITHESGGTFHIALRRYGREPTLIAPRMVTPETIEHMAVWTHEDGLVECWANNEAGLEHGFAMSIRSDGDGSLIFEIDVSGGRIIDRPDRVAIVDDLNEVVLSYDHLEVVDADGDLVPASIRALSGGIRIEIDDRTARYPLTVEGIVGYYDYETFFVLSQTGHGVFGAASGLVENFAFVGAPAARNGKGQVVFYKRDGDVWHKTQRIRGARRDEGFGKVLYAPDAETLFVGAVREDGIVYVFRRNDRDEFVRSQRIVLSSAGASSGPISQLHARIGTEVVVGLPIDGLQADPSQYGSVRVLRRNEESGRFEQVGRIDAPDGVQHFGGSVHGLWVGAKDHAFRISQSSGSWAVVPSSKIVGQPGDCLGHSVLDTGWNLVLVSAPCAKDYQGEVGVYYPNGGLRRRTLSAPDGAPGDRFGYAMALGNTLSQTYFISEPLRTVDGLPYAGRVQIFHMFQFYGGPIFPHEGSFVANEPSAFDFFGLEVSAGSVESRVPVPDPDPLSRIRRSKVGLSALVQGHERVELFDVDQVLIRPY